MPISWFGLRKENKQDQLRNRLISKLIGPDGNDESPLPFIQFVMIVELLLEDGEIGT